MVNLRDLRPLLAAVDLDGLTADRRDRALVDALRHLWRSTLDQFRCGGMEGLLVERLDNGRVFLVFDGLDEMSEVVRPLVRLALAALLRRYGAIRRILVTLRMRSYADALALGGFARHTLAPFDADQVRDFVAAWYRAQVQLGRLSQSRAEQQTADLQQAARSAHLRELATNPLLLTTMAIVHQREVGLPRERVRLCDLAVGVLLDRWQRHKGIDVSARLADLLNIGRGGSDANDAAQPLSYAFPHRTFQEYLAGCYLLARRGIAHTYWEHAAEGDYWYLAGQLGAEELLYNRRRPEELLDLMYGLCPSAEPHGATEWRAAVWCGQMATLSDRHEIEADTGHGDGGEVFLNRLIPRLLRVMREATCCLLSGPKQGGCSVRWATRGWRCWSHSKSNGAMMCRQGRSRWARGNSPP